MEVLKNSAKQLTNSTFVNFWIQLEVIRRFGQQDESSLRLTFPSEDPIHTEKYYSKNSYLGPEEMLVDKKPVVSTVFHAIFIASVAETARICYLK